MGLLEVILSDPSIPGIVLKDAKAKTIIGDFNFDSKESNTLSFYFAEIGMKQLVERPTRMSGRTIDHVYVSSDLKCELTFKSLYYSDHVAICMKLNKD